MAMFVAFVLCCSAIIANGARISLKELEPASMPTELAAPELPLLPKLPTPNFIPQRPKLQLPPVRYIPPFSRPGIRVYLPKLPELPRLPQLPSLPSLPQLPGLPKSSLFARIPGLPQEVSVP